MTKWFKKLKCECFGTQLVDYSVSGALPGTGLPRLSWKRDCYMGVVAVAAAAAVAVVVLVVHEVLSFIEFDMSSHLFVAVADTMTTASAVKVC